MENKIIATTSEIHIWIMESIKEYGQNKMPYYKQCFLIIDNHNNLKIFSKIINLINTSYNDIIKDICENEYVNKFIAPLSQKYNLTYFDEYCKINNIEFKYSLCEDNNKIDLFF